jgi:hypothetical protein
MNESQKRGAIYHSQKGKSYRTQEVVERIIEARFMLLLPMDEVKIGTLSAD